MVELSVLQEEQRMLRNELNQLKGCQLQYFTLSVTGTAALSGFAAMRSETALLGVAFLAPLAIVLPCWWIFFDKATTITRIVGYYRVIERMIAESHRCNIGYIGYERALALYRQEDDARGKTRRSGSDSAQDITVSDQGSHSHKKIRHRYWMINWCTYMILSFLCCVLSFFFLSLGRPDICVYLMPSLAFVVVLLFALLTWKLLRQVTRGVYSYDENHEFWEFIHRKHAPASMEAKGTPCAPDAQPSVTGGKSDADHA